MGSKKQWKHGNRGRISEKDVDRFYAKLTEAIEGYNGFGPLPPPSARNSFRRLFHMAYVKHYLNPEEDVHWLDSENWLPVYDEHARWLVSFPAEFVPEGLQNTELLERQLEKAARTLNKHRKTFELEYGDFLVRTRQGCVFLLHTGDVQHDQIKGLDK